VDAAWATVWDGRLGNNLECQFKFQSQYGVKCRIRYRVKCHIQEHIECHVMCHFEM